MGSDDPVSVDEEVEDSIALDAARVRSFAIARNSFKPDLIVVLIAAAIFLGCAFSPPHLMDDVDAVQAQIARNMLQSGDWVTARLNGIAYLEKSPMNYWMVAASFGVFGVHDWAARLPLALMVVAITVPWLILATLRNPPSFDFTLRSVPGQYHGFFWFYFINEHLLRFLNLRYPRDYNTVPRLWFWFLHVVWLFPWSFYFPAAVRLGYRPVDRAGRTRLLALCWAGFVMTFFSFSTTQEYYSLPIYPALALLLGSAMTPEGVWIKRGTKALCVVAAALVVVIAAILWQVWTLPSPGDISAALVQHPELYTLSLGHMGDLTLRSLAYLRLPLMLAGVAVLIGAIGIYRYSANQRRCFFVMAAMMLVFFHAARLAMTTCDPYLGSRPL